MKRLKFLIILSILFKTVTVNPAATVAAWKKTTIDITFDMPPVAVYITDSLGNRTGINPDKPIDKYGKQNEADQYKEITNSGLEYSNMGESSNDDSESPSPSSTWYILLYDSSEQDYLINFYGLQNGIVEVDENLIHYSFGNTVQRNIHKVIIRSGNLRKIKLHFNPNAAGNDTVFSARRIADSTSLLQDVQTACQLGSIIPTSSCTALQTNAAAIDAAVKSGDVTTASSLLTQLQTLLAQCNAGDAVTILTEESQVVLSALPAPTVSPSPTATNTPGPVCLSRAIVAASGSVLLNSGALVDSYNSGNGPYGSGNILGNGDVQASQNITNNGGTIHGQQYPNTTSTYTPIPTPSANLINLGNLIVNSGQTVSLQAGSYLAGDVNVNSNGILNAQGPVLVWYTGNLNLGGQVSPSSGKPNDIWFIGLSRSGNVNFNGGSVTQAVIFAPNAQANLNGALWGSLVCASVNLNSGAHLAYDESLKCQ
jgi:hypothetical protein